MRLMCVDIELIVGQVIELLIWYHILGMNVKKFTWVITLGDNKNERSSRLKI